MRGFFEIGIFNSKFEQNIGTLYRSAYQLGASGIFTIGRKYRKQSSDTLKSYLHIPLRNYQSFDSFVLAIPRNTLLIGIEIGGQELSSFWHPERAIYLLGAEDNGLPQKYINRCHKIISLESERTPSYNVAVAGSIVMYHRFIQGLKCFP